MNQVSYKCHMAVWGDRKRSCRLYGTPPRRIRTWQTVPGMPCARAMLMLTV